MNTTISTTDLRNAFSTFATGVVVITAACEGGPQGMAVNSFASASLDPALLSFFVGRRSTTWPHLAAHGSFVVNVLGDGHERLGHQFSRADVDRFHGQTWRPGFDGHPVLDDALAVFGCQLHAVHDAGDHELVLARVRTVSMRQAGDPLVFFRGRYLRLDTTIGQTL